MLDEQERLIKVLQMTTRNLLVNFSSKSEQLALCKDDVNQLIIEGYSYQKAFETAKEFFKTDKISFLSIDGTLSQDEELNMMIFYAGVFGYKGEIQFFKDKISYDETFEKVEPLNVSTAIPIHEEDAASVVGRLSESGIEVDTARLPSSMMQFAEYYLAVKKLEDDPSIKLVIFDRMPSINIPHLVGNSIELLESDNSILIGQETPFGKVSLLDMELCRMLHPNEKLKIPAARSQLLKYRAISWLLEKWDDEEYNEKISFEQLLEKIEAKEIRKEKLVKDLETFNQRFNLFRKTKSRDKSFIYKRDIDPNTKNYWKRVFYASLMVADHIFASSTETHPLHYKNKDGNTVWITTEDIDYLSHHDLLYIKDGMGEKYFGFRFG